MFGLGMQELLVMLVIALIVVGPKKRICRKFWVMTQRRLPVGGVMRLESRTVRPAYGPAPDHLPVVPCGACA
jgi:hypothetical protein